MTPWISGVILLVLAGFAAKVVLGFLSSGVAELLLFRETFFVVTLARSMSFDRDEQPTMFWFTTALYGAGALFFAGLGIWQFFR